MIARGGRSYAVGTDGKYAELMRKKAGNAEIMRKLCGYFYLVKAQRLGKKLTGMGEKNLKKLPPLFGQKKEISLALNFQK